MNDFTYCIIILCLVVIGFGSFFYWDWNNHVAAVNSYDCKQLNETRYSPMQDGLTNKLAETAYIKRCL